MAKTTTKTPEAPASNTAETTNPDESVQEFQQDLIGEGEIVADAAVAATEFQQDLIGEGEIVADAAVAATTDDVQTSDADVTTDPVVSDKGVAGLDRGRDYAQVFGKPGVAYEQDHKYFNAEGVAVNPELEA